MDGTVREVEEGLRDTLGTCVYITSLQLHHLDDYWKLLLITREMQHNLQDLKVVFGGYWDESNPPQEEQAVVPSVVHLNYLTSLSLTLSSDAYSPWIQYVRFPKLRHLSLELDDGLYEKLASSLSFSFDQSGCKVSSLQLHRTVYTTTYWPNDLFFSNLPHLTVLDCGAVSLQKLEDIATLLTACTSDDDPTAAVVPRLSSLSFDCCHGTPLRVSPPFDPTPSVSRIAEYRAEQSLEGAAASLLKEIRVGNVKLTDLAPEFLERSRRVAQRGCRTLTPYGWESYE